MKRTAGGVVLLLATLAGCVGGNSGPYMHHGKFTTMREAILAHSGEALAARQTFEALSSYDRDSVIEFLKSLQVLPPSASRADR